jgi:hypothetical protein
MTKPADSGQIAKARRISEIAEREKKATKGPWHRGDVKGFTDDCVYREDGANICKALLPESKAQNLDFIAHARADIPFLLSELASERQAVIEDCCRAVCYFCVGEPWKPAKLVNGAWIHECDFGPDRIAQCNAAAIRSME